MHGAVAAHLDMTPLSRLTLLEDLEMEFDAFVRLPSAVARLARLTRLVFRNNIARRDVGPRGALSYLPANLAQLAQLQHLQIDMPAGAFPPFVSALGRLTHLELSFMPGVQAGGHGAAASLQPVSIPPSMTLLTALRTLRMLGAEGGMVGLEHAAELPFLGTLALEGCSCTRIPAFDCGEPSRDDDGSTG